MVSVRCLCKIIGAVYCYSLLNKDVFYYEIQPSEWRSRLNINKGKAKREELKQMSIQYVKDNFGLELSDDEADAICIGSGYIKLFEGL